MTGAEPPEPKGSQRPGRVLAALIVGQLGLHAAMAGLRLGASLQTLREGYSPWAVGLLLALFAAAPVLTALPAGRLADRLGYHRPVQFSAALAVLAGVLAVLSTGFGGLLHFGQLCGAAMASGTAANTGMLVIQRTAGLSAGSAAERMRVFSWLGVAPSFSNVLGPVAVGFVIDAAGFRAAYLLLMLMPLATLAAARGVPRQTRAAAPGPVPQPDDGGRTTWDLLRVPGLRRLLVVNWLLSMCWDVHTFAVPILGHERGFSASTIGLILGSFTLSVTLIRLAIPWVAHRLRDVTVLRSAMVATALVFVVYPLAPTPVLMGLCAVVLGVTLGCVQPMVMSMLMHLSPDHRHGETLAFRSMVINASSTLMPLLFGAVGAATGAALLFWVVGAGVGAGAWVARRLGSAQG